MHLRTLLLDRRNDAVKGLIEASLNNESSEKRLTHPNVQPYVQKQACTSKLYNSFPPCENCRNRIKGRCKYISKRVTGVHHVLHFSVSELIQQRAELLGDAGPHNEEGMEVTALTPLLSSPRTLRESEARWAISHHRTSVEGAAAAPDPDLSEDTCFRCGDGGELLLCDWPACIRVYHMHCLKPTERPKDESG
eukprot:Rmarinus@m.207